MEDTLTPENPAIVEAVKKLPDDPAELAIMLDFVRDKLRLATECIRLGFSLKADPAPIPSPNAKEVSPHYTIDQAAAYLNKSRKRVQNLVSEGKLSPLPNTKGNPLFTREELERYLNYTKPRPGPKPKR